MKSFLKASTAVLGVIASLLVIQALSRALESKDKDDRLIRYPGVYRINGGQWSLVVEKNQAALVTYKLVDDQGKTLFDHGMAGFHSWSWIMYWEKAPQRLWLISHDIGTYVCMRDSTGQYQEIPASQENASMIKDVPQAVYDADKEYLSKIFKK